MQNAEFSCDVMPGQDSTAPSVPHSVLSTQREFRQKEIYQEWNGLSYAVSIQQEGMI